MLDAPLVTTFYGYDVSRLPKQKPKWKERYEQLFTRGALFLVEGEYMGEQLAQLGCLPAKIRVQRLGIKINDYPLKVRFLKEGGALRTLMTGKFKKRIYRRSN
ncbi:hypothetical protein GGP69_001362 [Salinibacter ruber]|nr:hypothetical protein [Salinibacter ruber]